MAGNKQSNSKQISFSFAKSSNIQYIKIIFNDADNKIREERANANSISDDVIKLRISKENYNINCPTGAVLKFITDSAIFYAKAILQEIKQTGDNYVFILKTPQNTIQKQNRRFYRLNVERPCVLQVNNEDGEYETYIAQSVNVSKGGILLTNVESTMNDEQVNLQLSDGDFCHIVIFLKHNIKIKTLAEFVRLERVDDTYRYAFQFLDMGLEYAAQLVKYISSEEHKLLKSIKK